MGRWLPIDAVRDAAYQNGWQEVDFNPQSRVVSFMNAYEERINVYYTTGGLLCGRCTLARGALCLQARASSSAGRQVPLSATHPPPSQAERMAATRQTHWHLHMGTSSQRQQQHP